MDAKPRVVPGLHVVFVTVLCCFCLSPSSAFRKDAREQFYSHVLVQPEIYSVGRIKRDIQSTKVLNDDTLTVGFVAFGRQFVVDLKMNKDLFSDNYFEKHHFNGKHVIHHPMKEDKKHCHYQGHLQGQNNTWAAVSICNGISGVIYDGNELHYIEPDYASNYKSHFVFKASDIKPQNLICGVEKQGNSNISNQILEKLQRHRRSTVLQSPYKSNSKSRYVELIIVNDNKEFKEFNQDKEAIFERSKQIANIVNGLYSPLNIFIALVGVIVWSDHDEITLSSDGDATLTNFLHYRRERLAQEHPNDNAQLITAMTFDGGVVGKALKGPICTYEYSGGVNMDHSRVVGLVATTVAHELGHNFGMEHDTDECQCPDEKCIMAPSSSSTSPRHWSSCSLEYLELAYAQGMDDCLKKQPSNIIGPVCGNGFLEDGEECDCGIKEFCDNHCCNATSCTLYQNASCAMGGCCDIPTCQIKKVATPCRESVSECDLPEFCDGQVEYCPLDTFRQNGEECGRGKAYCFDGQCRSHADQCKLLWGQTGKMSDLRCYEQNFKGNVNGNCGYNRLNQTYEPCSKEDVLCGMLHCTHLNERLEFGMESTAIFARSFINIKGKIFTCRSAIVDLGLSTIDPGLAPNGARCGKNKACVNQKCVSVDSIKKKEACPFGCSNNGVCNNRGSCHCEIGYGPPYCDSPGPGGSLDSGPASNPATGYLLVVALYIVLLVLVPLAIVSVVAIYYFRCHFKTWWMAKARKATIIKAKSKPKMQRKVQLPSKFNFDKNSLRTLEISAPIQQNLSISSQVIESGMSNLTLKAAKNQIDRTSMHCIEVSSPVVQNSVNNVLGAGSKHVPVRPAPPRPDAAPQRAPSWTPATAVVIPNVTRTSSFRLPVENNTSSRPTSTSMSRPNCPPPRPPPPRALSPSPVQTDPSTNIYDNIRYSNDTDRSATPSSAYYDDCQALDFSDTPLAFVHEKSTGNVCENVALVSPFLKERAANPSEVASTTNKLSKNSDLNTNSNIAISSKSGFPSSMKSEQTSIVAALAKRFENKNLNSSECDNTSLMRPPFKSRPLPARPDNSSS